MLSDAASLYLLPSREFKANNEADVAWYTLPRCIACETVLAPFLLWHRREEKDLDREREGEGGRGRE